MGRYVRATSTCRYIIVEWLVIGEGGGGGDINLKVHHGTVDSIGMGMGGGIGAKATSSWGYTMLHSE